MTNSGRGGARSGAGAPRKAPALKKQPVSIKLPLWLIQWLDAQTESRAVLIEDALRRRHKLRPPPVVKRAKDESGHA